MVAVTLLGAALGAAAGALGLVGTTVAGSAILGGALIYGGLATVSHFAAKALAPPPFNPIQETESQSFGAQARRTVIESSISARWILGRARVGGFFTWYKEIGDDVAHFVFHSFAR